MADINIQCFTGVPLDYFPFKIMKTVSKGPDEIERTEVILLVIWKRDRWMSLCGQISVLIRTRSTEPQQLSLCVVYADIK